MKMSEILNDAMKYIDHSQRGYLVAMDEQNKTCIINIQEFINDYTNVYFIVDKDVKKVKTGSNVNVYFENSTQKYSAFKSIHVSGKLAEIIYSNEVYSVLKTLIGKNRGRHFLSSNFKDYSIYKFKPEYINLCDYIKPLEELKEII